MATSGVFAFTRVTVLAAGDVFPVVSIADTTQSAHGSLDSMTAASLFASVPAPITLAAGTVTVSSPVFQATETWNAVGVTFTAIDLNITDTASASGSLLQNLRVGGASKWKVDKSGNVTAAGTLSTNGFLLTLAGALTTVGAFGTTITVTNTTSVTLPTSGTLVNTAVATLSSLTTVGVLASLHMTSPTVDSGTLAAQAVTTTTIVATGTITSTSSGTHRLGGANGNVTLLLGAAAPSGDGGMTVQMVNSNTFTNWQFATNAFTSGSASLTPSATVGAADFTTPTMKWLPGSGTIVFTGAAITGVTTLTTSSTINGQTISSAAVFTGTISAAGLPTSAGASGTLYVDGSGFVKRA